MRRREKPQTTISMDEECNKGEIVEDLKAGTKNDGSSDFWSSSTFEKDHSAAQSQRSVSSSGITMINLSDPQTSASSTPEFVNQGKFIVISYSGSHLLETEVLSLLFELCRTYIFKLFYFKLENSVSFFVIIGEYRK